MADLPYKDSTVLTAIVGSDSTGVETNYVNSTDNGDLQTADILNVSVVQTTLSVGTGASVEAKVGASPLTNRKSLLIQAQGSNLTYGFSSGSQPFTIANGTTITLAMGDGVSVWLRRTSGLGSVNVAIAEFA